MTKTPDTPSILALHMEISIAASPEKVWKALTDDIGAWWPDATFTGGESGKRQFVLEAEPGGRMYESWENGGLLWGTVTTIEPVHLLQVVGHTFSNWGGPSASYWTWTLEGDESGTVVRFEEDIVGNITEAGVEERTTGWTFLFEGALKAHLEGRPAPVWKGESWEAGER
jgi:uncharacterized protein YndB with AHSA1/START domain